MWFSEISLREKAAAGDFCGALVIFWCYSRGVVVTLVAGSCQWDIPARVTFLRRQSKEEKKSVDQVDQSLRCSKDAREDVETEK